MALGMVFEDKRQTETYFEKGKRLGAIKDADSARSLLEAEFRKVIKVMNPEGMKIDADARDWVKTTDVAIKSLFTGFLSSNAKRNGPILIDALKNALENETARLGKVIQGMEKVAGRDQINARIDKFRRAQTALAQSMKNIQSASLGSVGEQISADLAAHERNEFIKKAASKANTAAVTFAITAIVAAAAMGIYYAATHEKQANAVPKKIKWEE